MRTEVRPGPTVTRTVAHGTAAIISPSAAPAAAPTDQPHTRPAVTGGSSAAQARQAAGTNPAHPAPSKPNNHRPAAVRNPSGVVTVARPRRSRPTVTSG